MKENPAFEDFLGVFTQQEDLCVRFRYSEAPSLQSWLQRDTLSLMERLEKLDALLNEQREEAGEDE